MKYLIVYMSHHGTTRKVAFQLADDLGIDETTVVDLNSQHVPDLTPFDTIIIGGSIHAGQIQRRISDFCISNRSDLLSKRVGLFICAMESYEMKAEFDTAFPEWLRNHATAHGLFGGELLLDKMNFLEKIIVKSIYGVKTNLHELDQKAIDTFEKAIVDSSDIGAV